jgi:hypothetical protein
MRMERIFIMKKNAFKNLPFWEEGPNSNPLTPLGKRWM